MKHPFKLVYIGISVLFFGVLFANAEHVIEDSKNTGYLFIISGTSGSLDGDKLTLNGVPNGIYFSDRPARKAGHLSVSEFIEMWDKGVDSFKADPPNATLSVLKEDEARHVVVELTGVEQKKDSVVFKVVLLEGKGIESFEASSLFIDIIMTGGGPGP
ncbi:MAG: hypothetical protein V3U19_07870 [Thermodesulfobacteriota bacterium]